MVIPPHGNVLKYAYSALYIAVLMQMQIRDMELFLNSLGQRFECLVMHQPHVCHMTAGAGACGKLHVGPCGNRPCKFRSRPSTLAKRASQARIETSLWTDLSRSCWYIALCLLSARGLGHRDTSVVHSCFIHKDSFLPTVHKNQFIDLQLHQLQSFPVSSTQPSKNHLRSFTLYCVEAASFHCTGARIHRQRQCFCFQN